MKKLIALLLVIFLITSCSEETPVSSSEGSQKGVISLGINKSQVPEGIVSVMAELTREGFEPISGSMDISDPNSAEILFEEIEAGLWNLKVEAFNNQNEVKYRGETIITVIAGQTIPVSLSLEYVANETTGSIHITVTWQGQNQTDWIDHANNPMIVSSNSIYDHYSVWQPAVIKEEEIYKMWYTGLSNSGVTYIFYTTSTDGVSWTKSDEPVLSPTPGTWDSAHVSVGSVIRENSIYKLYYTGWADQTERWKVGLAVSNDGINWEKMTEPVFCGAEWDYQITPSGIIKKNGQYFMFYEGRNSIGYSKIGLATSEDGLNWERHPVPVLSATENWEGTGISWPSVVWRNGHFVMSYSSSDNIQRTGFGMAYSMDGVTWNKEANNPYFSVENTNNNYENICFGNLIRIDEGYRLYYSGAPNSFYSINMAYKNF